MSIIAVLYLYKQPNDTHHKLMRKFDFHNFFWFSSDSQSVIVPEAIEQTIEKRIVMCCASHVSYYRFLLYQPPQNIKYFHFNTQHEMNNFFKIFSFFLLPISSRQLSSLFDIVPGKRIHRLY